MCVRHPMHPSFFVEQAVELLHPHAAVGDAAGRRSSTLYASAAGRSGRCWRRSCSIRDFHDGPADGEAAGGARGGHAARAPARASTRERGSGCCRAAGQQLFYPPDVSGWDDTRWLDTGTRARRAGTSSRTASDRYLDGDAGRRLQRDRDRRARPWPRRAPVWGDPEPDAARRSALLTSFAAERAAPAPPAGSRARTAALRQNALRQLIAASPDLQMS